MLEGLMMILRISLSCLSSDYVLKCHTGRDNQNGILAVKKEKKLDIYMEIKKRRIYSRLRVHEYGIFVPVNCVY